MLSTWNHRLHKMQIAIGKICKFLPKTEETELVVAVNGDMKSNQENRNFLGCTTLN